MIRDPIFKRLPAVSLPQLAKALNFYVPAEFSESQQSSYLNDRRDELEDEFSSVGSHLLGRSRSYREIVVNVAKKLGARCRSQDATAEIERRIISKVWDNAVANMTPAQAEELRIQAETLAAQHGVKLGKHLTGVAALTAAQLSGFGVYVLGSTLLGAVNGAFGLGLGFGAFTGLSTVIATVIGPIGWIALGFSAVVMMGGPNYKKLVPAIIMIATVRDALDRSQNVADEGMFWGARIWLWLLFALTFLSILIAAVHHFGGFARMPN